MILGEKKITDALGRMSDMDMRRAAAQAIKLVQAEAKLLCPVNHGELRGSIHTSMDGSERHVTAVCYTNKGYAPYVEFGTGPKGQRDHGGISPDAAVAYRQSPWWVHESQIDVRDAERYHWRHIDTEDGRFYLCHGQAAQPYMYPALKNQEDAVVDLFRKEMR